MKTKHWFVFVAGRRIASGCLLILQVVLAASALAQPPEPSAVTFIRAIRDGDTNTVFEMLKADTNLAHAHSYGALPLQVAASKGSVDIVDRLLKNGADINAQGDTWDTSNVRLTALEAAIWYGHPNVCKLLLEAGADPNIQSATVGGALHYAFAYHQTEIAGWLLDHGANPFLERSHPFQKQTPLEAAITQGDGTLVSRMLTDGPKYFAEPNAIGNTPPGPPRQTFAGFLTNRGPALLSMAAQRGELDAVQAMLKAGISTKASPGEDKPLLQRFAVAEAAAARADHFDPDRWLQIRRLLISNGAIYDAFAATARGDLEQARRLSAADKSLAQARDGDGQTPLHWAVQNNQLPLTSFWLEAGASPAATNSAGQTALHIAAANNLVEHAKVLLAAHAPTDARDTNGWTPIDAAIHMQQTETIRLLLSGTNVAPRSDRAIALSIHQAAASGNLDALSTLADVTNNLEARDELGLTPLQVAVQHGHLAAAALLVDKGANVNVRDPDGNTLLHRILLQNIQLIVYDRPPIQWLDRMGEDPRKTLYQKYLTVGQYEQGPNPVLQSASFLLACGLDARATNHAGQTAVQLVTDEKISPGIFFFNDDLASLLKLLASGGGSINAGDADGNTPLHLAGQSVFVDQILSLMASGADINATNHKGQTPLHKFAEKIPSWGESDDATNSPFQLLLKYKPNVNAQDNDGLTPLHVLALARPFAMEGAARLLLAAGADPNLRDKHGRSPAHLFLSGASSWSEVATCFPMLAKAGAELSTQDEDGKTPLHCLAAHGDPFPMFFIGSNTFSTAKAAVALRDKNGDTPLHIAARTGTREVFDWLLKQGADLDATNDAGETPRVLSAYSVATSRLFGPTDAESDIFLAVRQAKLDSATRLLAADRKLANLTNRDGQTPLRAAVLAQRTNMIELLEKNGAQWDEVSAVVAGRADALREILRQRPAAVSTMLSGASLLDLAADHGEVEIIKTLLASNADVRALDWSYRSPVGHALLAKRTDIAELLIQHGAKETLFDAVYADDLKTASALIAQDNTLFSATNGFGALVVQAAVARGHTDILEFLLNQGAPADGGKVLRLGKTPLHLAAISNQTNIAQLLIKHGAKVEAYDNSGFTPLHCAAWQGSSEVAALLLKNKANPDTGVIPSNPVLPTPMMRPDQSLVGDTALHLAAINGQTNLVQILLKSGASINAANSAGRTALDLASQPGVPQECVSITRSMSGTPPKNYAASLIERRKAAAAMLEASGGKHSGQSQAIPSRPVPGPPPRP